MQPETKRDIENYIHNVTIAARCGLCTELWRQKDFATARAREIGYGLADYIRNWQEVSKLLNGTYSTVLVVASSMSPPLDARDWMGEIKKGFEKRLCRTTHEANI